MVLLLPANMADEASSFRTSPSFSPATSKSLPLTVTRRFLRPGVPLWISELALRLRDVSEGVGSRLAVLADGGYHDPVAGGSVTGGVGDPELDL